MADNHPKILAPTGAKNNPPTLIALTKLERLVAETCADDIARMQSLPEMYKSYREFVLVHGGRGRDEPKNLRKGEVRTSAFPPILSIMRDSRPIFTRFPLASCFY